MRETNGPQRSELHCWQLGLSRRPRLGALASRSPGRSEERWGLSTQGIAEPRGLGEARWIPEVGVRERQRGGRLRPGRPVRGITGAACRALVEVRVGKARRWLEARWAARS